MPGLSFSDAKLLPPPCQSKPSYQTGPMKNFTPLALAALFLPVLCMGSARANTLQASPVMIEMTSAAPTSAVTVRNSGRSPYDVQTRIFRWQQQGGVETLVESDDVVTSPPIVTLKPGVNYSVRIVKVNGEPVQQEEAYRLLVDQLPDEDKLRSGVVALVMRHSIPVFMLPEQASAPNLHWSLAAENGRLVLQVKNTGGRRVRLSGVSVTMPDGRNVAFGSGLLGYVLAGSTMQWRANAGTSALGGSQPAKVRGSSDQGLINATAKIAR